MTTWYNSKFFVNFADYSSVIISAQNVLMAPEQNVSIPLDQHMLTLLVINIYD